jgi:hypothetical protein
MILGMERARPCFPRIVPNSSACPAKTDPRHTHAVGRWQQNRRDRLNADKLIAGIVALSLAPAGLANGAVPLGTPVGDVLGGPLGLVVGSALPIAGGGLLTVAAVSLVIGIRIVRRKRGRQAEGPGAHDAKE